MAAHKILMSISSTQASYPMYTGSEGEGDGLDTRLFKYMKSLRQNLMIQVMIDSIIQ